MDFGAGAGRQVDFYHIKACFDFLLRTEEAQPVEQAHAQKAAFGGIDHAYGGATAVAGGAFHLYGYQGIAMAAHEVELTTFTPAPVTAQHLEPASTQIRCCHQLAVLAHTGSRGRRGIRAPGAAPFVQQAQTCGDGES